MSAQGLVQIFKLLEMTLPIEVHLLFDDTLIFYLDNERFLVAIDLVFEGYGVIVYKKVVRSKNWMLPLRETSSYIPRGTYKYLYAPKRQGYAMRSENIFEYWKQWFKRPQDALRFVLQIITQY